MSTVLPTSIVPKLLFASEPTPTSCAFRIQAGPSTRRGKSSAFSLVECVLAIGVVAFAFVGLLALLPTGMSTFRKSMDLSVGGQIGQRVIDDLQQSEFDTVLADAGLNLTNGAGNLTGYLPHRFFDDQGNEVTMQNGGTGDPSPQQRASLHILYDVHTQIAWKGQIPSEDNGSCTLVQSPSLCVATVQIINNPAGMTLPLMLSMPGTQSDGGPTPASVTFVQQSAFITRTGMVNPSGAGS